MKKLENYKLDFFYKDLEQLSVSLNEKQICQFMKYFELLVEWNKVMNLTAITDFDEVCKKHFIDSLSLVKAFDISSAKNLFFYSENPIKSLLNPERQFLTESPENRHRFQYQLMF